MTQPRTTALTESITIDMTGDDGEPAGVRAAVQRVAATRATRAGEVAPRATGGGPSRTRTQHAEWVARVAGESAARGMRRGDAVALLVDGPRMGEDGGGNDAPPAGTEDRPAGEGTDGEDGGGNDAPPAKDGSDGEDGGGNDAPAERR